MARFIDITQAKTGASRNQMIEQWRLAVSCGSQQLFAGLLPIALHEINQAAIAERRRVAAFSIP